TVDLPPHRDGSEQATSRSAPAGARAAASTAADGAVRERPDRRRAAKACHQGDQPVDPSAAAPRTVGPGLVHPLQPVESAAAVGALELVDGHGPSVGQGARALSPGRPPVPPVRPPPAPARPPPRFAPASADPPARRPS